MQELARLLMQRLSLWDPFVLTALHKADLLITLTQDTKDMLPGFARRKAFVITRQHISVAPTAFDYVETDHPLAGDTARGSVRLLYIGRLLEWKGLMLVLYALDKLRGTGDYRFTIIGQGPAKNFYQAYAEKRGLDVVFLSPTGIPRRKLSSYYLGHDLFAFPSLHGTAGYVMLEAQLHNLPVLMLDITAPPSFERFERDIIITTKKRTVLQVVDSVATAISSFVRQEKTSIPASKQ
jgi:glycosyltransferase involved in cell wall biosynthesis